MTQYDCSTTVVQGDVVHALDLAARLDSTAEFLCKAHWGNLCFPPPFGREAIPEVRLFGKTINFFKVEKI